MASQRGSEGTAPSTVVASAPATAAACKAVANAPSPPSRARRALKAPQNASPAPVVSTGVTGCGAIRVVPALVTSRAPRGPSVTTTAPTPRLSNASAPPSNCSSCSFGVITSRWASSASGNAAAGAGLSTTMVLSPASAAARCTTSSGTSSCMSSTLAREITRAAASISPTESTWLAPGTTMIRFSASSETPISARPVGASTLASRDTSTPSSTNARRSVSPAASRPTAPTNAVRAPARAAAIA